MITRVSLKYNERLTRVILINLVSQMDVGQIRAETKRGNKSQIISRNAVTLIERQAGVFRLVRHTLTLTLTTHTLSLSHTHTLTQTHTHTCTHSLTLSLFLIHTHTQTHSHSNTHVLSHSHSLSLSLSFTHTCSHSQMNVICHFPPSSNTDHRSVMSNDGSKWKKKNWKINKFALYWLLIV